MSRLRSQLWDVPRQVADACREELENPTLHRDLGFTVPERVITTTFNEKELAARAMSSALFKSGEGLFQRTPTGHPSKDGKNGDGTGSKRKSIERSGSMMNFASGLKGAVKHDVFDGPLEVDAISPRTLQKREECAALAKKHGLVVQFVETLRDKFDKLDTSHDGTLEEAEFGVMVQWLTKEAGGVAAPQLKRMWMEFDEDKSGDVNFSELMIFLIRKFPHFKQMTSSELNRFLRTG